MKHLLSKAAIGVMAAASMASCSNESELAMPEDASNAMRFSLTQRNSSRGTATTSTNYLDQIQGFQVWGHYTAGATGEGVNPGELYVGESATVGTFIKGDGAGAWDYEDILDQQYWPATTAPLNFQAVTPATGASFTAKITEGGSGARLCAEVTVPTATADQKDIMLAASLDQTRETNAQCVALTFKHAMSQVVFNARMASEKITAEIASIEIANVHAQGTVGFADDYSLTSQVTGDASTTYSVGLDNAKTTLTTAATVNVTAEDGALFMLPQTVEPWQTAVGSPKALSDADLNHNSYLKVRCTVTDNTSETVLIDDEYVYIPFAVEWQQGKKYAYTLVFGDLANGFDESGAPLENMLPISYTVQEVDEWNGVDGGEFGVGGEIVVPRPDFSAHNEAGYAVTSTSTPTQLVNDLTGITEMWIEKVDATRAISVPVQIEPCLEYTFAETGNYKMYLKLEGTKIGNGMFKDCGSLTSITIPEGVKTIGDHAFLRCTALETVTLPEGVTTIGTTAFAVCTALETVTLPEGVTTIGQSAFSGCTGLTSIEIPEGVTEIGQQAFKDCTGLTSIVIPEGVKTIGQSAFSGCTGLTSITIPEGVTSLGSEAFRNCTSLTGITIPEGVTKIGSTAFYGCKALTSVVIPEGVTSIESHTFYNCSALASVTLPSTLTAIGSSVFESCGLISVEIPEGVTTIGGSAFKYCSTLTSASLPSTLTAIGDDVFKSCGLISVEIPEGVTTIGNWAFGECSSLTSVVISSTVTNIGRNAFYKCTALANIVFKAPVFPTLQSNALYDVSPNGMISIPTGATGYEVLKNDFKGWLMIEEDNFVEENGIYYSKDLKTVIGANPFFSGAATIKSGVKLIADYAFAKRTGLTSIVIPEGVTSIGVSAFDGCTALEAAEIPEGVTSVGERAFQDCTSLTSITIPEGVTYIGKCAFYRCTALASFSLPSTLTEIGSSAFYSCKKLTSIVIPEGVTTIGQYAFNNCTSLSGIVCKAMTAPEIGDDAFGVMYSGVLTVPAGATGYDEWMKNESGYLGYYNWTKVESNEL